MWVADGGIVKQPSGYAKYGRQQSYCYYPKPWLALEVKDPVAYIWDMYKRWFIYLHPLMYGLCNDFRATLKWNRKQFHD